MRGVILVILALSILSCETDEQFINKEVEIEKQEKIEPIVNGFISEQFFDAEKGWGYRILSNGKPYINQPHIPSIPGKNGFESEEKAKITATFVIEKLKKGIMPPSVTKEELDSLQVL